MPITLTAGQTRELNVSLEPTVVPPPPPPPPPPPELATLYGRVVDAETGYALAGVLVNVNGYTDHTDSGGNYEISNIPPGTYPVLFQLAGYESVVK